MHRLSIRPRTFLTSQSFKRTLQNHASGHRTVEISIRCLSSFHIERLISYFPETWFLLCGILNYSKKLQYFGKLYTILWLSFCWIILCYLNKYRTLIQINNWTKQTSENNHVTRATHSPNRTKLIHKHANKSVGMTLAQTNSWKPNESQKPISLNTIEHRLRTF